MDWKLWWLTLFENRTCHELTCVVCSNAFQQTSSIWTNILAIIKFLQVWPHMALGQGNTLDSSPVHHRAALRQTTLHAITNRLPYWLHMFLLCLRKPGCPQTYDEIHLLSKSCWDRCAFILKCDRKSSLPVVSRFLDICALWWRHLMCTRCCYAIRQRQFVVYRLEKMNGKWSQET